MGNFCGACAGDTFSNFNNLGPAPVERPRSGGKGSPQNRSSKGGAQELAARFPVPEKGGGSNAATPQSRARAFNQPAWGIPLGDDSEAYTHDNADYLQDETTRIGGPLTDDESDADWDTCRTDDEGLGSMRPLNSARSIDRKNVSWRVEALTEEVTWTGTVFGSGESAPLHRGEGAESELSASLVDVSRQSSELLPPRAARAEGKGRGGGGSGVEGEVRAATEEEEAAVRQRLSQQSKRYLRKLSKQRRGV